MRVMNISINPVLLYSGTTGANVSHTINGKFGDYDWLYFYSGNSAQGWGHLLIPRTKFVQGYEEWLYIGIIGGGAYHYCSVGYIDNTRFRGVQVSSGFSWNIEVYGISLS